MRGDDLDYYWIDIKNCKRRFFCKNKKWRKVWWWNWCVCKKYKWYDRWIEYDGENEIRVCIECFLWNIVIVNFYKRIC